MTLTVHRGLAEKPGNTRVDTEGELAIVGQFLPCPINAFNLSLATEDALGSDFACDSRHLARAGLQLVLHGVDGALEGSDLGVHFHRVHPNLLGEVTARNRRHDLANLSQRLLE